jgi:hypothetical protein
VFDIVIPEFCVAKYQGSSPFVKSRLKQFLKTEDSGYFPLENSGMTEPEN